MHLPAIDGFRGTPTSATSREKLAVELRGRHRFGSSSNLMRTGSVTPSPKAWPGAGRGCQKFQQASARAGDRGVDDFLVAVVRHAQREDGVALRPGGICVGGHVAVSLLELGEADRAVERRPQMGLRAFR